MYGTMCMVGFTNYFDIHLGHEDKFLAHSKENWFVIDWEWLWTFTNHVLTKIPHVYIDDFPTKTSIDIMDFALPYLIAGG